MIKAIATDLDGTLFYPKTKIHLLSADNKQFIRNAVSKGLDVILVTGRNYTVSSKVERAVGLSESLSVIGCNGAFIAHRGEKIKESVIDTSEAIEMFKELSKDRNIKTWMIFTNKKHMLVETSGMNFFEKIAGVIGLNAQGAYYEPYRLGYRKLMKELSDPTTRVYKMMPWFGYRKNSRALAMEASKKWNEQYGDKFEFYYSEAAVEIQKKGVNKAKALEELLQKYNVSKEEVLVVGDSGNDIPMFQSFPNSFVMSHAPESVKKEAKHEIDSVADLEKYIY